MKRIALLLALPAALAGCYIVPLQMASTRLYIPVGTRPPSAGRLSPSRLCRAC